MAADSSRFPPTTPAQAALLPALLDRLLVEEASPFGVPQLPPIKADAPEFMSLKVKPHAQLLGLDPTTTPLAAVIGLASPADVAARFKSLDAALEAGSRLQHGAALLYGLQTGAIRWRHADCAEALVRFAPNFKVNFQFDAALFGVLEPSRLDRVLVDTLTAWDRWTDAMVWSLLESHAHWSVELSQIVIHAVRTHGTDARTAVWTWRGNGYADNMHLSLLNDAVEAIRPFQSTQPNAKRWLVKLKKRVSSSPKS